MIDGIAAGFDQLLEGRRQARLILNDVLPNPQRLGEGRNSAIAEPLVIGTRGRKWHIAGRSKAESKGHLCGPLRQQAGLQEGAAHLQQGASGENEQ